MVGDLAVVAAIEAQKRGKRVNVIVDGAVWTSAHRDVVYECSLRKGDPANPELLDRLQEGDERHRAYEGALLLLSYRPRTEGELRQRLRQKGVRDSVSAETIERLRRAGLIDDATFAASWVQNRGSGRAGKGKPLLAAELRAKGVASDLAAAAVSEADESVTALEVARAQSKRLRGLSHADFVRRLGASLRRRGFGYDTIADVLRTVWREQELAEDEFTDEILRQ